MNIHIVVDFTFLYYKYIFSLKSGRLRRFTTEIEGENKDVTMLYYPLKEVEGFRRDFEKDGHNVTMSICFDAPTTRKEDNEEYKSNRTKVLADNDYENITKIREMLTTAGYNTYFEPGYEADDLVSTLINKFKNDYGFTVAYTPDKDILVNIAKNVGVYRYKAGRGYTAVGVNNLSSYCSEEFNCGIPYNAVGLYLTLCGDKADVIKGVVGFGPVAFNKLVGRLDGEVDWEKMSNTKDIKEVIESLKEEIGEKAYKQAIESLNMVGYREIENIKEPIKEDTKEKREDAYMPFKMTSLVD